MSLYRHILAAYATTGALDEAQCTRIAQGLASGEMGDAEAGAFAMAVRWHGLDAAARRGLTGAMRDSGTILRWDVPGPVVDKHSTGGVSDSVSLILAPLLAACGAYVPMISGRALAHTGGTLDKLEAIAGVKVEQDLAAMQRIVAQTGCAIVAASAELAPADRRLYAIRDRTATVDSRDLITASILSKKLAEGLDALVLDVKLGSGAILADAAEAQSLAATLVETARGFGCATSARLSDMSQPLASAAGHALEIGAAMDVLAGDAAATGQERLRDLTLALAQDALALAGLPPEHAALRLADGSAAARFEAMIAAQGGPTDLFAKREQYLAQAPVMRDVFADKAGHIRAINMAALGEAVHELSHIASGGRDPAPGLSHLARLGAKTQSPLCRIHARNAADADAAEARIRAAFEIGEQPPAAPPLHQEVTLK